MLTEAIALQRNAVSQLCEKIKGRKREITFKAPTGSGKTYMMGDMMNRLLAENNNLVFIVSTLSKGDLGRQNYESFQKNVDNGRFPNLKPYLINSDISGEETLFIPLDYNVYVLPRDLYKDGGRLMQGGFRNFLLNLTEDYFGRGLRKTIYLIKDECHDATNNIDKLADEFFKKIINVSATPDKSKGQIPDVWISDEDAVEAKLIKDIEWGDENETLEDAIRKLEEIKSDYVSLGVNPCLIIQISNKDKAIDEWNNKIKPVLDKTEHQSLKWMVLVDQKRKNARGKNETISLCDTNDKVKSLPIKRWKDYAKKGDSTIDVIVFKMVISEGWDIPRACMLFQLRDTTSTQLDQQVMGRVRRNPRLLDFENIIDENLQKLATTAWIWGIVPDENKRHTRQVKLWGESSFVQDKIKIKTLKLRELSDRKDFDYKAYLNSIPIPASHKNLFELYRKLEKCSDDIKRLCYEYAGDNSARWWHFLENVESIQKLNNQYICDYEKSLVEDKVVSFPVASSYVEGGNTQDIDTWVWCRKDSDTLQFAFDSESERLWAVELEKISSRRCEPIDSEEIDRYLWGKNFPVNSEIKYDYYLEGIHASYPDFVMKDKRGNIHIFEVKSVNKAKDSGIDKDEYEKKVNELKKCYKACSKLLSNHHFYLPIRNEGCWDIWSYINGVEDQTDLDGFKKMLSNNT